MRRLRPELDLHKKQKGIGILGALRAQATQNFVFGTSSLSDLEGHPVDEQKFYSGGNRNLVHQTSGIIILTKVLRRLRNFVI